VVEWTSKLRSALKGQVPADDIAAGLVASHPLDDLRQRLDDRRLEQNLAYPHLPWTPVDALGPLATSLWLADVVVALVGRVYDAHQPSGSGARAIVRMNGGVHGHLAALLALVPPLLQEVSIALTDHAYAPAVRLPMAIGLRGAVPGNLGYLPVDASYLRGLLAGTLYLQHAVEVALEAARGIASAPGAPAWLGQVVGQVDKRVAAHAITVESLQARGAPLLARRAMSDDTIFDTTVACWDTISSYVEWGQILVYPRLGMPAASLPFSLPPPATPVVPTMARPPVSPPSRPPVPLPGAAHTRPPAPPLSTPRPAWQPAAAGGMPRSSGPIVPPIPVPAPAPGARPQDAPSGAGGQASAGAASSSRPRPIPPDATPPAQRINAPPSAQPPVGPQHPTARTGATPATSSGGGSAARVDGRPSAPAQGKPAAPRPTSTPASRPTNPTTSDAIRAARATPAPPPPPSPKPRQTARTVGPTERWLLTTPEVRQRLRRDGREEIAATGLDSFWRARRWTVYQDEQDYLDAVTRFQEQGLIEQTDIFRGIAPFAPVYRVVAGKPAIDDVPLRLGQTFTYDHDQGRLLPR